MGRFLKLWMQANNLTISKIAKELSIPVNTLSNYMAGKPMGTKHLVKLSRYTGISCRALIENHDRNGEAGETNEPWHNDD